METPNFPILWPPKQDIDKAEDPPVKLAGEVLPPEGLLKLLTHPSSITEMYV